MAPAALENLPRETVQQIASSLNLEDVRSLSLACRSLRSKLYRLLWSRVLIYGGDRDLLRQLKTFDPESEHGRATLALVKNATILEDMAQPCYHIDQWDVLKYPVLYDSCITKAVMETLQAMTSLESLNLNILGLAPYQELEFVDLLQGAPDFKLQHLTIRARLKVAKPFILRCSRELRSLDTDVLSIPAGVFKSKKLEKLRIHLHYNRVDRMLYQHPLIIDDDDEFEKLSLRKISNHLPALKTLILHETRTYGMSAHNATSDTVTAIIANTLKKRYPRLERLAFTSIWLQAYGVEFSDTFFHNLVGRIATEHRVLKEICVLVETPRFHQWKRDQSTALRDFHEMPNPNGFPFGVED